MVTKAPMKGCQARFSTGNILIHACKHPLFFVKELFCLIINIYDKYKVMSIKSGAVRKQSSASSLRGATATKQSKCERRLLRLLPRNDDAEDCFRTAPLFIDITLYLSYIFIIKQKSSLTKKRGCLHA